MTIPENVARIMRSIANAAERAGRSSNEITLLPVTKSVGIDEVQALWNLGYRQFGENRIEVLNEKRPHFSDEACWHFIGTLQRKKVRKVLQSSHILHSIDSLKLAEKVSQVAVDENITIRIFLEVNSGEEQKGGFAFDDLRNVFPSLAALPHITVSGLMTMAPFVNDEQVVRNVFSRTRALRDELNGLGLLREPMTELSMGMSNDYEIAIEEGSTLVRVGTALYT